MKILALIRALYTDTESAARYGGGTSDFSPIPTGVRQGCVHAPSLFSVCMDWMDNGEHGQLKLTRASFGDERFPDYEFSSDDPAHRIFSCGNPAGGNVVEEVRSACG